MKIRKGPFGHFVTTCISTEEEIFNYAEELINSGYYKELLPVYIDSCRNNVEVSFDFSGLASINENKLAITNKHNLAARRISLRDFFLSLSQYGSTCLFPNSLVLDPNYIFTDSLGETIKFCMLPIKKDSNSITVKSINFEQFELLLNHPFISEVLTNDEIQEILFAVAHNDNKRLKNTATKMSEPLSTKAIDIKSFVSVKLGLLVVSATTCVISLINAINANIDLSLLLLSITAIILLFSSRITTKDKASQPLKPTVSTRKEILFDNTSANIAETIPPLFLRSNSEIDGKPFQYAMFTNRAVIGSDCFLSDLNLDYLGIDYVQAEILQKNNSYFLVSKSNKYPTYLEHRKILPEKEYEIKDGQTLTVGDIDLSISIGFG